MSGFSNSAFGQAKLLVEEKRPGTLVGNLVTGFFRQTFQK